MGSVDVPHLLALSVTIAQYDEDASGDLSIDEVLNISTVSTALVQSARHNITDHSSEYCTAVSTVHNVCIAITDWKFSRPAAQFEHLTT